jgi:Flp pilus assembly protein CpaB
VDFAENLLSSRRGTLLIGAGAAILAAILLVVYLNRYRSSLKGSDEIVPVLVAKQFIQKGAPGNVIGTTHLYQIASVPKKDVRDGALVDPTSLRGLVSAQDIYKGQQLTAADFVPTSPDALQNKLSGSARAISISIDASHGLAGQVNAGDHVDVYVGVNIQGPGGAVPALKLLMQNALILRTPGTGATPGTVVLRANGDQAPLLAYAADNGKIWLVLRPATGAKNVRPGLITAERLLGARPVR